MNPTSTRTYARGDDARIVELAPDAWGPVFDSFRAVLGEDLYRPPGLGDRSSGGGPRRARTQRG